MATGPQSGGQMPISEDDRKIKNDFLLDDNPLLIRQLMNEDGSFSDEWEIIPTHEPFTQAELEPFIEYININPHLRILQPGERVRFPYGNHKKAFILETLRNLYDEWEKFKNA